MQSGSALTFLSFLRFSLCSKCRQTLTLVTGICGPHFWLGRGKPVVCVRRLKSSLMFQHLTNANTGPETQSALSYLNVAINV